MKANMKIQNQNRPKSLYQFITHQRGKKSAQVKQKYFFFAL